MNKWNKVITLHQSHHRSLWSVSELLWLFVNCFLNQFHSLVALLDSEYFLMQQKSRGWIPAAGPCLWNKAGEGAPLPRGPQGECPAFTAQTQPSESWFSRVYWSKFPAFHRGECLSLLIAFSSVWLSFAFSVWMSHVWLPFCLFKKHTPFPLCIVATPTHSTAAPKSMAINWPLDEPGLRWGRGGFWIERGPNPLPSRYCMQGRLRSYRRQTLDGPAEEPFLHPTPLHNFFGTT